MFKKKKHIRQSDKNLYKWCYVDKVIIANFDLTNIHIVAGAIIPGGHSLEDSEEFDSQQWSLQTIINH